jgi:hypothetical protein
MMPGLSPNTITLIASGGSIVQNSMVLNSFLLATVLQVGGSGNPPTFVSDGTNSWFFVGNSVIRVGGNNLYFFAVARNQLSVPTTFLTDATGTVRFWVSQYTGQTLTGNPVVRFMAADIVTTTGRSLGPLEKNWSNLTSIFSGWFNPTPSPILTFDGGAGLVQMNCGPTTNGVQVMNATLGGVGNYTATWTQTTFASGNAGLLLVKSPTSKPLGGGLLLGVG